MKRSTEGHHTFINRKAAKKDTNTYKKTVRTSSKTGMD